MLRVILGSSLSLRLSRSLWFLLSKKNHAAMTFTSDFYKGGEFSNPTQDSGSSPQRFPLPALLSAKMATPFLLAQNIFTALTVGDQPSACHNATAINGTIAQDQTQPGGLSFPTDILSLITFLLSLSALGDWVKLIALGSVLETCRRLAFHFCNKFYNSFFIKVTFEDGDSSYGT